VKIFVLLLVLGAGGYSAYAKFQDGNPESIENPVFAEIRIDANAGGRELNMVLFGEMADEEDCRTRAHEAWDRMIAGCAGCKMTLNTCKAALEPRYQRMFDNQATHSTYLTFARGSRYERDGRMVIFGLTSDEGDAMCETIKSEFKKQYTGQIECIQGRRD
jgi:hypothetical protein